MPCTRLLRLKPYVGGFGVEDVESLRAKVQQRMLARPAASWSPRLLLALVAVFDLEFGGSPGDGGLKPGRPRLTIVR